MVEPVTSLNLEVVMSLMSLSLEKHLKYFFEEDDLGRNLLYFHNLPQSEVTCLLKFKNDGVIAGLPIFEEVFKYSGADAALAASVFHFGEIEIPELKAFLKTKNIDVR